jgi:LCP family protein required for cell wall assembly
LVLAHPAAGATVLSRAPARPAVVIHRVDEAHFSPAPGDPVFMLVVGSDMRPGQDAGRGDALHLIGMNPSLGKATILNIPRDTWVAIPGHSRSKINDALALGGAPLQAQAVGQLVGVAVSFVITTDFEGLIAMVDDLGGVDVDVPIAMDDSFSGAKFAPGRAHLDGHQALAFTRNRHIPDGDLRRTEDQGLLILAALAKLRADSGPVATMHDLGVLFRHTRMDGVGVRDLYRMGRMALTLDPANVRNVTMPATLGWEGAASVVFPGPGAAGLFADFRDDAVLEST